MQVGKYKLDINCKQVCYYLTPVHGKIYVFLRMFFVLHYSYIRKPRVAYFASSLLCIKIFFQIVDFALSLCIKILLQIANFENDELLTEMTMYIISWFLENTFKKCLNLAPLKYNCSLISLQNYCPNSKVGKVF